MPVYLIPSFLFYCYVGGITPGPANLCSFAAAIRYGRRAALRQWRGLFCGFAVDSVLSGLLTYFLGTAFQEYVRWFSIAGCLYILWLAFRVLTMKIGDATAPKDCSFWNGFFLQLTNVKVMLVCLTALNSFILPYTRSFWQILLFSLIMPFTGPVMNLIWLFAGSILKTNYEKHPKVWNIVMALSLIWCAVSILISM